MNASVHTHPTTASSSEQRARTQRFVRRPLMFSGTLALISITVLGCAQNPELSPDATATGSAAGSLGEVTLVVHDSFPNTDFETAASLATGYDVKVISAGDGGELTNKLVLTQGAPIADAFFGVDNVYASRVVEADVAAPYAPAGLPDSAAQYLIGTDDALSPITRGATCINIDPAWFEHENLPAPSSYADLADPEYAKLTVLLDPSSSSTGASFLIGTVAEFGVDGFAQYWSDLAEGGARIEQSWSAAYNGQFTQGGGDGTYPIVLSYSSSPAWTLTEDGTATTTAALLDTCSSQVEYAGVLNGAANPEGAQAVIDYMLTREFQDTIADTMFVYPVDDAATISEEWQTFAEFPSNPRDLTGEEIGAGRESWLREWSDATGW